ncbi:nucleotidyltransferase [Paraburkholderia sediminicola]|uniref:nucleotidyltransferase domain-containing protein n=1 Tax=Paraburkholderia sediminicola TaxID=458836 RepID=UPI0038BAEB0D
MRRDLLNIRQRRSFSDGSSTRFFALVDAMAHQQMPTITQLDALQSSYESTGKFLSEREEFGGLLTQIHSHGSRHLGTLVKPADESRDGFDIDLIARFDPRASERYGDPNGPSRLLSQLNKALADYANAHGLTLQRHDRCVTLRYAGGMCADIAPVIDNPMVSIVYGETHGLIPDKVLCSFESTNPRGYSKFFNEVASIAALFPAMEAATFAADSVRKAEIVPLPSARDVFDRLLCRFVQVIKLHRNFKFGPHSGDVDLKPSSVFITTLATLAYKDQAPNPHNSPLELLLDIVETMPSMFYRERLAAGNEEWHLPNPAAPRSNLAGEMNTPVRQEAFTRWIDLLFSDIEAILIAIEAREGMHEVVACVAQGFGPRSARAVRDALFAEQQSTRLSGKANFLTAAATPVAVASRQHNFFGS